MSIFSRMKSILYSNVIINKRKLEENNIYVYMIVCRGTSKCLTNFV